MMHPARTTRPKRLRRRKIGERHEKAADIRIGVAELTWIVSSPTRSSVADHPQRWFISQSSQGRMSAGLIDLDAIDNANGRHCLCANGRKLDAFRNERASHENEHLFGLRLLRHSTNRLIRIGGTGNQARCAKKCDASR
jgi:hypothetical protein